MNFCGPRLIFKLWGKGGLNDSCGGEVVIQSHLVDGQKQINVRVRGDLIANEQKFPTKLGTRRVFLCKKSSMDTSTGFTLMPNRYNRYEVFTHHRDQYYVAYGQCSSGDVHTNRQSTKGERTRETLGAWNVLLHTYYVLYVNYNKRQLIECACLQLTADEVRARRF